MDTSADKTRAHLAGAEYVLKWDWHNNPGMYIKLHKANSFQEEGQWEYDEETDQTSGK